jgi:hypothetical protein
MANPMIFLAAAKVLQGMAERRERDRERKRDLADIEAERSERRDRESIEENRRQAAIFEKRKADRERLQETKRQFDLQQQSAEANTIFKRRQPTALLHPKTGEEIGFIGAGGDVKFFPQGRAERAPQRNFLEEKLAEQFISGKQPIRDDRSLAVANPILKRQLGVEAELSPRPGVSGWMGRFMGGLQEGMGMDRTYGQPEVSLAPMKAAKTAAPVPAPPPPTPSVPPAGVEMTLEGIGRAVDRGILTPEAGDALLKSIGYQPRQ